MELFCGDIYPSRCGCQLGWHRLRSSGWLWRYGTKQITDSSNHNRLEERYTTRYMQVLVAPPVRQHKQTVTAPVTTTETNINSITATALKLPLVIQRITQLTRSPFVCHKKYENRNTQQQPCEPSVSLTYSSMWRLNSLVDIYIWERTIENGRMEVGETRLNSWCRPWPCCIDEKW